MNLIIDIGNTRTKVSVFNGEKLIFHKPIDTINLYNYIVDILDKFEINSAILSSVIKLDLEIELLLSSKLFFIRFSSTDTKVDIYNDYKTPQSLGSDRLSASIGALLKFSDKNILVINAGTCVTYDLITFDRKYIGGGISNGLQMRFNALNYFTDKLPNIVFDEDYTKLVGQTTQEAILSGVQNGFIEEIKGMITRYNDSFENLAVIISGGDGNYIYKNIVNNKLVKDILLCDTLVSEGLNYVLNYNKSIK